MVWKFYQKVYFNKAAGADHHSHASIAVIFPLGKPPDILGTTKCTIHFSALLFWYLPSAQRWSP
jgi:hypothetical protein